MGTVFLCEDILQVRRKVALKVLRADRIDDSEEWSKVEYEALTRLRHPNLARVFDFGRVSDSHDWFIVSEFIRGDDLLGASTTFEENELLDIIVQICRALEYIHVQGYVHFDIKPDNILVTKENQMKITDLGLATDNPLQTHTMGVGTKLYKPDEQKGQKYGKSVDIYPLGNNTI